eukprot:scaffold570914_cov63-Attheya_sp.AAC.1
MEKTKMEGDDILFGVQDHDDVPEIEFNDAVDGIELSYDDALPSTRSEKANVPCVDSWRGIAIKDGTVRATIGKPMDTIC